MARQFIKFLRYKKFGGNKRKFRKEKNNKGELCNRDVIISYEGKKLRHIKYDCLNVIKRSKFDKNQKALMASTWDEKDESATSSSDYNSKMEE
jgi:hypothetical protein